MKLEHFLNTLPKHNTLPKNTLPKINSKWIKDLNVRPETVKLLEENIGRVLDDINQSKTPCDPPCGVMEIKTQINKWDLIKLKSFCTVKQTINKVKRQASEWGEIRAKETTDKELISRIYKQLIRLNIKQSNQKVRKRPQQTFLQRRHTDGWRHMERCSSLIIREIQIKTTMRYHLTPVRMAITKKSTNNKCWGGCREKGTLLHCWWECKLIQPLWKTVWRFL